MHRKRRDARGAERAGLFAENLEAYMSTTVVWTGVGHPKIGIGEERSGCPPWCKNPTLVAAAQLRGGTDKRKLRDFSGSQLWHTFYDATYRLILLGRIKEWQTSTLATLLYRSASSLATDPRDKAYGLLSLRRFSDGQMILVPDYSKTVERVLSETTYSMLLDKHSHFPYNWLPLHPLHITVKPPIDQAFSGLPSWALDLTISSRTLGLYDNNDPYRLVPQGPGDDNLRLNVNIPRSVKVSEDFKQLVTCGVHLGTIAKISGSTMVDGTPTVGASGVALYDIYNNILKPQSIAEDTFLQVLTIEREERIEDVQSFNKILNHQMEIKYPSQY
ncbi:uncharacterized protein EKO05_0006807 [Ascochyta rabiei]|uniref:uncharacterized protein n=1 Tax=Didymella rabiei TaxID=5454 RepID=UPI0022099ECB|nr:uncharacterized protein EKO05_0006807 [Ascochyta rabiei]UPX16404.1 hypothetical protein EKO05_0006807 [Ascochyta rabiei]